MEINVTLNEQSRGSVACFQPHFEKKPLLMLWDLCVWVAVGVSDMGWVLFPLNITVFPSVCD